MSAFLIVTLLFIAMAFVNVRTALGTATQSRQLDEAHQRVAWSQQIEQALARQMHFSVLALLSQDEAAIGKILRENNLFNETLAKLDAAGLREQHGLVRHRRAAQGDARAVLARQADPDPHPHPPPPTPRSQDTPTNSISTSSFVASVRCFDARLSSR
jgi:hypothetical protein